MTASIFADALTVPLLADALTQTLTGPLAQRVAWALVHFLWQGLAIAALLAGATVLLRRRSPHARYAVACLALATMAVLPVATAMLVTPGAPSVPAPLVPAVPDGIVGVPPAVFGGGETVHCNPPAMPAPELNGAPSLSGGVVAAQDPPPTPAPPAPARTVALAPTVTPASAAAPWWSGAQAALQPLLPWALLAWVAGVTLLSVWHLGGWVLLRRIRRAAAPLTDPTVLDGFDALLTRLRVSRPVRVLQSAVLHSPMVIGWWKPVVLLPLAAMSGLSPLQVQAILAHELAHIRRYDCLVRLLQALVETLLFYHPAVWWVSARVRQESEHCCDALAVRTVGSPRAYAAALAHLAELAARPVGSPARPAEPPARLPSSSPLGFPLPPSRRPRSADSPGEPAVPTASAPLAASATGGKLLPRIRRILGVPDDAPTRTARTLAGAGVLVSLLIAALIVGCAVTAPAPDAPADPAAVDGGKGDDWLVGLWVRERTDNPGWEEPQYYLVQYNADRTWRDAGLWGTPERPLGLTGLYGGPKWVLQPFDAAHVGLKVSRGGILGGPEAQYSLARWLDDSGKSFSGLSEMARAGDDRIVFYGFVSLVYKLEYRRATPAEAKAILPLLAQTPVADEAPSVINDPRTFSLHADSQTMQHLCATVRQKYNIRLCLENPDLDTAKDPITIEQAIRRLEATAAARKLSPNEQLRLELAKKMLAEGKPATMIFDIGPWYTVNAQVRYGIGRLLTEMTRNTPYTWLKTGDSYVVLPRAGSKLAYPVTLNTAGLTVREAVQKVIEQQPPGSAITYAETVGMPVAEGQDPAPWLSAQAPPLDLKDIPAMEVLRRITEFARPESVWTLHNGPNTSRVLVLLPGPKETLPASGLEKLTVYRGQTSGRLEFDKDIPVPVKVWHDADPPQRPDPWKVAAAETVRFQRTPDNAVRAVLKLGYASWPKATYRAKLELLDREGAAMFTRTASVESDGTILGVPLWETEQLSFEFTDSDHEVLNASAFRLTLSAAPTAATPTSAPLPPMTTGEEIRRAMDRLVRDPQGVAREDFDAFVAATRDRPAARKALADAIVSRVLDGPGDGTEPDPRRWLHGTYFIDALHAMRARDHLLELLGPNRRYASAFDLICCVGPALVAAVADAGKGEDAWRLLAHVTHGRGSEAALAVHDALCRLTGIKLPPPGPADANASSPADELALARRTARIWAEYLAERQFGPMDVLHMVIDDASRIAPQLAVLPLREGTLWYEVAEHDGNVNPSWRFLPAGATEWTPLKIETSVGYLNSAAVSPDRKHLAIVTSGEGHPFLDVFDLPALLSGPSNAAGQSGKPEFSFDPYVGYIEIVGWEGERLRVRSNMPLDRPERTESNRIPADLEMDDAREYLLNPADWAFTAAEAAPPAEGDGAFPSPATQPAEK